MDKILKIYTYIDGENDTPFPNDNAQIEIVNFNYSAKRMGGAPTISASIMYGECLDKLWTGKEYVVYNGERYKLKQTPTSSKSNTDARYKHDLELVALRVVLDYVYFYDAVVGNTPVDDKPVTNSTKVVFSGDIHQFAKRLNASLQYTKLDYSVVVDKGITSETKLLSFEDQPISNVLQEIYKQYEIPYYFVGNVIHIGFTSNAITRTFKYGAEDALLSISKNNTNNMVVTRCTGVGSSENIPYYYPNEHPLGIVDTYYKVAGTNSAIERNDIVINQELFAKKVKNSTAFTYVSKTYNAEYPQTFLFKKSTYEEYEAQMPTDLINDSNINENQKRVLKTEQLWYLAPFAFNKEWASYSSKIEGLSNAAFQYLAYDNVILSSEELWFRAEKRPLGDNCVYFKVDRYELGFDSTINVIPEKDLIGIQYFVLTSNGAVGRDESDESYHSIKVSDLKDDFVCVLFRAKNNRNNTYSVNCNFSISITDASGKTKTSAYWQDEKGRRVRLEDYGLTDNGAPKVGDKITFQTEAGSLMPFQHTLMPSVYRNTFGKESFYNAYNDIYISPETGEYYVFENEYSDDNRREHKESFDYIKPSIENVKNADAKPINMFLEFAYDENDNDEVDEQGNYVHPYFYAKLRKFNGDSGFNLFDHAIEQGEMTISMTSGHCSACNLVIGVNDAQKNTVQVDDNGDLVYENGRVKLGTPQDRQNDTVNNEVWVALKKDEETFGMLLPNSGIRPKACTKNSNGTYKDDGDTFVITNIALPKSYIYAAEERLDEEIIKYMKLNNSEKFTFSIKFSRIYLAQNADIFAQLNENARVQVEYNGAPYELYVSSYQYKVNNDEALPEITVELSESLSTNENAIQRAINAVEHSIMSSVGSIDFYKQGLRYFIRKDVDDWARGLLHFTKGATFGSDDIASIDEGGNAEFVSQIIRQYISTPLFIDGFAGEGFKLWLDENGKSNLTVDNLTARETFRVFELIVTKLRAVNGGLFISAANGIIKQVKESEDGLYYDILLENTNTFVQGDYMRCQVTSGTKIMSYWVEIASVDGNTCRVLKSEFGDATPLVGHEVVLDGSTIEGRQNAIHISASDDGQPRIDILDGITTKSHAGCTKTRLGNLDGITDELFKDNPVHGYGLYSDNAFLKGDFILRNSGKNVETQFAITEEGIKSAVGSMQDDMEHGGTILYNPSFTMGENGWITSNVVIYYLLGNSPIFNGNSLVVNNAHENADADYNHRFILNINDGYIKQLNEYFVNKPEFSDTTFVPLMFGLKIMVEEDGNLLIYMDGCNANANKVKAFKGKAKVSVGIDESAYVLLGNGKYLTFSNAGDKNNVDDELMVVMKDGEYELYNATRKTKIYYSSVSEVSSLGAYDTLDEPVFFIGYKELFAKEEYLTLEFASEWNGTGNFNLAFTGGASIYSLQLSTDMVEVRHATLFEQTERLLKLTAGIYDKDQQALKESGIVVRPEGVGIYTQDANGNIATIGTYEEGVVKLTGNEILLEGNVTANGNVSIDGDGRITAKEANITGRIEATSGKLGEYFEVNENGLNYSQEGIDYVVDISDNGLAFGGQSVTYVGLPDAKKRLDVISRFKNEKEGKDDHTILRCERTIGNPFGKINGYSPLVDIKDTSSYPEVALSVVGGLLHKGAYLQQCAILTLPNEHNDYKLRITSGNKWVVKNKTGEPKNVFLPRLEDVLAMLQLTNSDNKDFAIPMSVTLLKGSAPVFILFQDDESTRGFVNWDGDFYNGRELIEGDTREFLLINDSEDGYYAHITNHNV